MGYWQRANNFALKDTKMKINEANLVENLD